MQTNSVLKTARKNKNDEFFTQLFDVENELDHYKEQFKGKKILCSCNDEPESGFRDYFLMNMKDLGIKSLTTVSYTAETNKKALKADYAAEPEDGIEKPFLKEGNKVTMLHGNGDFRSQECLDILDNCDIVCTNPPFSLFREFVHILMEHRKSFLIIGNMNCITYKDIFPLIRDNRMWLGYRFNHRVNGRNMIFRVPDDYPMSGYEHWTSDNGRKYIGVPGTGWFTNLDTARRHEPLPLKECYSEDRYPKYDNYDAIEVDHTVDIPIDYDGIMGVPITFMDKYCPEQFEILGDSRYHDGSDQGDDVNYINGKLLYRRILIRYTQQWKEQHPQDFN